jgi:hypothetical protein
LFVAAQENFATGEMENNCLLRLKQRNMKEYIVCGVWIPSSVNPVVRFKLVILGDICRWKARKPHTERKIELESNSMKLPQELIFRDTDDGWIARRTFQPTNEQMMIPSKNK